MNNSVDINDLEYVYERFGEPVLGEPVGPFSTRCHYKDHKVSVFHVKPVYYKHTSGAIRPLSEVTDYHGNQTLVFNEKWGEIDMGYLDWLVKRSELLGGTIQAPFDDKLQKIASQPKEGHAHYSLTISTFYPDPNVESTSVDGLVLNSGAVYLTVHGASAGTSASDSAATGTLTHSLAFGTYYIARSFYLFDTSALPNGDTLTAATFSLAGPTASNPDFDSVSLEVVSSSPASNTAIVTGDFDQTGGTSYASMVKSAWSIAGYNDFSLSAAGIANITKTGVSKFGFKMDDDLNASAPSGLNHLVAYYADQAGTGSDPKLTVTHNTPATAIVDPILSEGVVPFAR